MAASMSAMTCAEGAVEAEVDADEEDAEAVGDDEADEDGVDLNRSSTSILVLVWAFLGAAEEAAPLTAVALAADDDAPAPLLVLEEALEGVDAFPFFEPDAAAALFGFLYVPPLERGRPSTMYDTIPAKTTPSKAPIGPIPPTREFSLAAMPRPCPSAASGDVCCWCCVAGCSAESAGGTEGGVDALAVEVAVAADTRRSLAVSASFCSHVWRWSGAMCAWHTGLMASCSDWPRQMRTLSVLMLWTHTMHDPKL